jgi:hypothetical protein
MVAFPRGDPVHVQRYDQGELTERFDALDATGALRVPARLTRTGVFSYRLPDGATRRELRHPDEVFKADSLASLSLATLTLRHPKAGKVDSDTFKALSVGTVGEKVGVEATKFIKATVVVKDAAAVQSVQRGDTRELSCGYTAELIMDSGTFEGQPYDARQTNITYNHVALVERGRAGSEVRVLDGADELGVQLAEGDPRLDHPEPSMIKIKLDGVDFEAPESTAQAVEKTIGTLQGKADAEKARADGLQAKLDAAPKLEQLRLDAEKAVRARLSLEQDAHLVLGKEHKCDGIDDDGLRKAVIVKLNKDVKLDGQSPEYLRAMYDVLMDAERGRVDHVGGARPAQGGEVKLDDYEQSVIDLRKHNDEMWKTKVSRT